MTVAFPRKWAPETRRIPYIRFTLLWTFSTLRIRPGLLLLFFFFFIRDTGTLVSPYQLSCRIGPPSLRQGKFYGSGRLLTTRHNGGLLGGLHLLLKRKKDVTKCRASRCIIRYLILILREHCQTFPVLPTPRPFTNQVEKSRSDLRVYRKVSRAQFESLIMFVKDRGGETIMMGPDLHNHRQPGGRIRPYQRCDNKDPTSYLGLQELRDIGSRRGLYGEWGQSAMVLPVATQ
ncbi:uncharacterized protein BDW70DRAFT_8426 [Aspergillus foveolatus]|uniref:uncharacterized protein n=1 Tax=Aspergillus foveolatus TaxID=210207 RepID=UPI003CCD829A